MKPAIFLLVFAVIANAISFMFDVCLYECARMFYNVVASTL